MPDYYDLGSYTRPVSTASAEAQLWFDRGLLWGYGYHHEEAARCYRRAIEADPACAMAWWGLAYVTGCNYNKPWIAFDPEDARQSVATAFEATRTALGLAGGASPVERALIEALPSRYQHPTPDTALERWNDDFAAAMRHVHAEFPADADVAAIFAEAMMNRTPWQLWDITTGTPAEGADTLEAAAVLERGMSAPGGMRHPGLLHLYIHVMEMSPHPEKALPAANALRGLVPDSGHLNHMPTHIDVLLGDYAQVIASNQRAIEADTLFLDRAGPFNFYSLYRLHDYHFRIYGAMFAGQYRTAIDTADAMIATLPAEVLRMASPPMADWLEGFVSIRQHVLIRFGRWQDILDQPMPEDAGLFTVTTAMLCYGKAVAQGVLGDVAAARDWAARFEAAYDRVQPSRYIFNNTCRDILCVAREMMLGEIAYRAQDYDTAFAHLRRSVELDDGLPYDEPWGWMQPTRHALGALLLEQGHVAEAEAVYRQDLGLDPGVPRPCWHPGNIWALRGLSECLIRLGRPEEAAALAPALAAADARTDLAVKVSCMCRKTLAV